MSRICLKSSLTCTYQVQVQIGNKKALGYAKYFKIGCITQNNNYQLILINAIRFFSINPSHKRKISFFSRLLIHLLYLRTRDHNPSLLDPSADSPRFADNSSSSTCRANGCLKRRETCHGQNVWTRKSISNLWDMMLSGMPAPLLTYLWCQMCTAML